MAEKSGKKRKNILYNVGMRWRIFIYLLGFACIMICLLWLFQIVYLNDFYESIKKGQIETAANSIAANVENEDIQGYAEGIALHYNLCAEVYALDSANDIYFGAERLASVDLLGDCIIHHIAAQEIVSFYYKAVDAAKKGAGGYMEIYSRVKFGQLGSAVVSPAATDEGLSKSLVYARVVEDKQGESYLLLLNSSITPVSATVATLRLQLIIISGGLILLALIISFMIARRLSSPISQLNKAAKRLAGGDLSGNFPAAGYKEIAELADTLNYASSQLSRTDTLQKDLVANISHDIRTPLTMIGGYAEYMRDFPDEDHSESIGVIVDETQRLRDLVNDILDNSRLMAGVPVGQPAPFDLSESLTNFVGNYNHLIEPQGYRVELDAQPGIWVNADEKHLLQAVSNMMNNAVSHIGPDKLVRVALRSQPGAVPDEGGRFRRRQEEKNCHEASFGPAFFPAPEDSARSRKGRPVACPVARLTVADHGCGISSKDLPYIWDRYYHADAPGRGNHGSGLGLSIVRGIMEMHNARYGVSSRVGEGSVFWFELPLEQKLLPPDD